jgi:ubiquinone/menaquinone biosynthesis C-methylase UbiE
MLPADLSSKLQHKEAYTDRLMQGMEQVQDPQDAGDPDTDRFMWEHHLYNWGKRVVYGDAEAAAIFLAYADKGARDLCRYLGERCGGVSGKRLLYVGSGNDTLVALPLQQAGAFLVNMDVVSESVEDLLKSGAENCVCGDIRRLPFRSESFDVVFSKGSLHHSQPIDKPLKEMARVARSGGHIIAVEPNKNTPLPHFPLPAGLGHPTPYEQAISRDEVVRILSGEGIKRFRSAAFTRTAPGTPPWLARAWEWLGRTMPLFFDRYAFEFILHGRKP